MSAEQTTPPTPDAGVKNTAVLRAADVLYDRVESLFYAAPETHATHYERISAAMRAYDAARTGAR